MYQNQNYGKSKQKNQKTNCLLNKKIKKKKQTQNKKGIWEINWKIFIAN